MQMDISDPYILAHGKNTTGKFDIHTQVRKMKIILFRQTTWYKASYLQSHNMAACVLYVGIL